MKDIPLVTSWIATCFVLIAAGISAYFYRHARREYARGKTDAIPSSASFRLVYRYLQVSTVIVAIAAQWSNHPALLKAFYSQSMVRVGVAVAAAGLGVYIWAKLALGRAYSPCFDALVPQSIVTVGPYRWVRHPIYSGNIILLIGLFLASGSLWIALNAVILAVYYVRAAVVEETVLQSRFQEYGDLLIRTGRFLPKF